MLRKINISTKLVAGSLIFSAIVAAALIYILTVVDQTSDISVDQRAYVQAQVEAIQRQDELEALLTAERHKIALANEVDREFRVFRAWMLDLSVSWLNEAEDAADASMDRLTTKLQQLADIDAELASFIQGKSEQFKDIMLEAVDAYVDENRVKGNSLVADGRILAEEISSQITAFQQEREVAFKDITQQTSDAGLAVTEAGTQVENAANSVVEMNSDLLRVAFTILVLFLVLSGLYSYVMRREVCVPIERLRNTVEQIQKESDLSIRFEVRAMDEIGITGVAFNRMMEQFSEIVKKVCQACKELDQAMSKLMSLMQQAREGAMSQQQATSQVATAINEMAATVQEVALHTQQATRSTERAKETTDQGISVVNNSVDGTVGLSNLISEANTVIARVESDSSKIGSVLDVIRGISEQTNLLALNAAIEAARAGESGRGFAVVADEVRTLAQKTQESTEEIDKMISNLQSGSHQAVELMAKGNQDAQSVASQAEEAGAAFQTIETQITEINDLNTQIATSAEEQSAVADEINQNVNDISDSCTSTSEAVEQTAEASDNLMKLSRHLACLVKEFKV